jgi:uncharacterized protein (DUF3820 family)
MTDIPRGKYIGRRVAPLPHPNLGWKRVPFVTACNEGKNIWEC